jgi:hypothetical protein
MEKQNQVKRTLSQPDSIETVRELLRRHADANRTAVTRAVCRHFGFVDARGAIQLGSCLKALRDLESAGHFVLPPPTYAASRIKSPRGLGEPVPAPLQVPAHVGAVHALQLIRVDSTPQLRIWNEMMLREHPQGAGPLVGRQLRYLIHSEHGWLGALGFGAAALQLADRDRWIGWDARLRREYLHRVIGMNRFLIRPAVRCRHLASHVLGMALRRIGPDFEERYQYRPWLVESFVEQERFAGTCYQASNWVAVGQTKGRGRQDRANQWAKTVKTIYLYALQPNFRALMGVRVAPSPLDLEAGLEENVWASHEFGGACLGDERLGARLIHSARLQATDPGQAFTALAQGDWPAIKGHYRLIDHPDEKQVTMAAILAPHQRRTVQRMAAHDTVLCIQDGTDLSFAGLAQCEGLGVIGTNQTQATTAGLHLHSTYVLNTEGLPLGVLNAQCYAPVPKADPALDESAPLEQKKTFDWIRGLRQCAALAPQLPQTRQVCVMDREADFFELFDAQRRLEGVDLLVRAKHDRKTGEEFTLFESVRRSAVRGLLQVPVPRQSARPKRSRQQARAKQVARTAQVELRYGQVTLCATKGHKDKGPITLGVVHVRESDAPPEATPLEWFLLTTCPLTTVAHALQCVQWYCLRWRIEDWHRVLKSGCRIEALAHKRAARLQRAIAIRLVIAWRIMLMTLLGRTCPALPPEVMFSDLEIEVLRAYAKKNDSPRPSNSPALFAS